MLAYVEGHAAASGPCSHVHAAFDCGPLKIHWFPSHHRIGSQYVASFVPYSHSTWFSEQGVPLAICGSTGHPATDADPELFALNVVFASSHPLHSPTSVDASAVACAFVARSSLHPTMLKHASAASGSERIHIVAKVSTAYATRPSLPNAAIRCRDEQKEEAHRRLAGGLLVCIARRGLFAVGFRGHASAVDRPVDVSRRGGAAIQF